MPSVKINDLNNLKGAGNTSFAGAMNEGQQTVDKVKEIVNGVNNILTKVQSFKEQAQTSVSQSQGNQNLPPTPTPTVNAPSDMIISTSKRAVIEVKEDKIIPLVKEFFKEIDDGAKGQTLKEIIEKFEGNEQVIKAILIQLIKQTTSLKYID